MRSSFVRTCALLVLTIPLLAASFGSTKAQTDPTTQSQTPTSDEVKRPTSGSDRLFLSFVEDGTVIEDQWWEGRLNLQDQEVADVWVAEFVAAFNPWKAWELGGRVGFGNTDSTGALPDGSGATDLDVWGKYYLKSGYENTEFTVGGILTVPTGDDTAGLGFDAWGMGFFGAVRHRFRAWILSANAGFRLNSDGARFGLPERDGETSIFAGFGAIVPLSQKVRIIAETRYETERFQNTDPDWRALGGFAWQVGRRGRVRAALSIGLSDGAPDAQLLAGYAAAF